MFGVITIFINRIMCSLGMDSFTAVNINAKTDRREGKVNYCWGEKAIGTGKNNMHVVKLFWYASYPYLERRGILIYQLFILPLKPYWYLSKTAC